MKIPESEKEYREVLREKIEAHEKRIHIEQGPIPRCYCDICKNYRAISKCGPEHYELETMCQCPLCATKKYFRKKMTSKRHYKLRKKRLKEKHESISSL